MSFVERSIIVCHILEGPLAEVPLYSVVTVILLLSALSLYSCTCINPECSVLLSKSKIHNLSRACSCHLQGWFINVQLHTEIEPFPTNIP